MTAAAVVVFILVVAIPTVTLMTCAIIALVMGGTLKGDAEQRYSGSELVTLNR